MSIAQVHGWVIGVTIIGSWLLVMILALGLRAFRADAENGFFWRLVSIAQVLLGVQLILGLALLAIGRRPADDLFTTGFHLLYGFVFPFIVLVVAHRSAGQGRIHPLTAFAVAGLVNFGLTARGWMAVAVERGII